jgi:hypothetical protein
MKKKLRWTKGINRINFPIMQKFGDDEADKEIKKVKDFYKLPKYKKICYQKVHYTGKDPFTLTEVFIER